MNKRAISQALSIAIVIAIIVAAFGGYFIGYTNQAKTTVRSIPAETITEVVNIDSAIGGGGGGCLTLPSQNKPVCGATINLTTRNTTILIGPSGSVNATLTRVTSYGDLNCSDPTTIYTTAVVSNTTVVDSTWYYRTCS